MSASYITLQPREMHKTDIDICKFLVWDAEAFRLLYKFYYKALVNYSMQLVVSQDEAEDIVQSVFTLLLEKQYSFLNMKSLEAFLYNTTRNSSLDKLRHKNVEDHYIKSVEERYGAYPTDDSEGVYSEDVYRLLFDYIDELPPKSREVFLLYIKGKTNREISEMLGVSFETVKTHKKRSMAFLRKKFNGSGLILFYALSAISHDVIKMDDIV